MRPPSNALLAWRPWSSWSTAFGPAGRVLGRRVQFRLAWRTPSLLLPPAMRRSKPEAPAALVIEMTIRTGLFSGLDDAASPVDADDCDVVFEHRGSGLSGGASISRSPAVPPAAAFTPVTSPQGSASAISLRRMKDRRGRAAAIGAFFLTGDGRAAATPRARDVSTLVNSLDAKDGARPTLRQLAWVAAARGLLPSPRPLRGRRGGREPQSDSDDGVDGLQLRVTLTDLRELEFTAADSEVDLSPA